VELVGKAATAGGHGVFAAIQVCGQSDHQGGRLPFGEELLDGREAHGIGFVGDHRKGVSVACFRFAHCHADAGQAEVEAEDGSHSGVSGDVRELGEIHAEELHGGHQPLFGGQVEDDGQIGRYGEPGVLGEFVFELAGGPAGVAERHQHFAGLAVRGQGLQHVAGAGEADTVSLTFRSNARRRRAVQHESPVGLHRAAEIHGQVGKLGLLKGMSMRSNRVARRISVGRLTMTPIAPFSLCSAM
jgi:hypothetical protein